MTRTKSIYLALLVMLSPIAANADPIQWTIQNFIFDDGGTATGSFVFDADTGTYSDISITTTAGTARAGATYSFVWFFSATSPTNSVFTSLAGPDLSGGSYVRLDWSSALTNLGGTVLSNPAFSSADEGTCISPTCNSIRTRRNFLTGASAVGVPISGTDPTHVPEPSTLALLTLGLVGMAARRRKKV